MSAVATVLGHLVERKRGTVHLTLRTEEGAALFRLPPAEAKEIGSELRLKAVQPVGERCGIATPHNLSEAAARGLPLEKPAGGI